MRFVDILDNERLWSVFYDGDSEDILSATLSNWINPSFLRRFFTDNAADLCNYFHITNLDQAIYDTVADAVKMSCLILDISPEANLDEIFRPLENYRANEMILSREKAKGERTAGHPSWLRLYAIKLEKNTYLITGGAIKLTHRMNEREHTLEELRKLETVRNHLIDNGVTDLDALQSYNEEQ